MRIGWELFIGCNLGEGFSCERAASRRSLIGILSCCIGASFIITTSDTVSFPKRRFVILMMKIGCKIVHRSSFFRSRRMVGSLGSSTADHCSLFNTSLFQKFFSIHLYLKDIQLSLQFKTFNKRFFDKEKISLGVSLRNFLKFRKVGFQRSFWTSSCQFVWIVME